MLESIQITLLLIGIKWIIYMFMHTMSVILNTNQILKLEIALKSAIYYVIIKNV